MDTVGLSFCRLQLCGSQIGRFGELADGCLWAASSTETLSFKLRAGSTVSRRSFPEFRWSASSPCTRQAGWLETEMRRSRSGGLCRGSCLGNPTLNPNSNPTSDMTNQILKEGSAADEEENVDIVILSNGPGEVATWVKPVIESLRTHFGRMQRSARISVVLAPCPHASGAELELVSSYEEVDRCQGPGWFWKLLLLGSTKDGWNWHKRGVCIFLGGDQFYALLLGLRLGYKTIIYAEDAVRWPGLAHMYVLRSEEMLRQVPSWARASCKVVGDLFLDAVSGSQQQSFALKGSAPVLPGSVVKTSELDYLAKEDPVLVVGLLPGSKGSKLALGVPYFMAVAVHLHELMKGSVRFVLPLAPTATLDMLAFHADADSNPFISQLQWASGFVVSNCKKQVDEDSNEVKTTHGSQRGPIAQLVTCGGVQIEVWQEFPAYDVFRLCTLCLTTVGTNTAELGLLGIPMLVVLPTHALEVFKGATGGALGLLANAPGWLGNSVTQALNLAVLKSAGYIAWPNRWAGEEVVPELVGRIEPTEVAAIAAHYLKCGGKLRNVQQRLLNVCQLPMRLVPSLERIGSSSVGGAAEAIAVEVGRLLTI